MSNAATAMRRLLHVVKPTPEKQQRNEFDTMQDLYDVLSEHTPGQQMRILQAVAGRLDEENAGRPDRTYRFEE